MGMGFAPTWLRQVSPPLLHKTTLTTGGSDMFLRPTRSCRSPSVPDIFDKLV